VCNTLRVGYFTCDRQVWLCGEVVTVALKDRFTQLFPHIQLLNLYSISECHDITCSGKLIIIICLAALGLTVSLLCFMTSSLVQQPSDRPTSLRFPSVPVCQGVRLSFSQNCWWRLRSCGVWCCIRLLVCVDQKIVVPLSSGWNSPKNLFLLGQLDPEDESTTVLQNTKNHSPDTVSHPRRSKSSYARISGLS